MNEYFDKMELKDKYYKEYKLANEVNSFLYELAEMCCKKGNESKNVYIIASICQICKFYKSAILLLENGLTEPAFALLRSILELSLKIIEVIRDNNFFNILISNEQREYKKLLKYMQDYDIKFVDKDFLNSEIKKVEQNLNSKEKSDKKVIMNEIAKNNKLYKAYLMYKHECEYVHLSIKAIMQNVENNDENIVIDLRPKFKNFKDNIKYIMTFPIFLIKYIVDYVGTNEAKEKFKKFEKLVDEYQNNN